MTAQPNHSAYRDDEREHPERREPGAVAAERLLRLVADREQREAPGERDDAGGGGAERALGRDGGFRVVARGGRATS